mmetsp:Transcript_21225/g.56672  ORF Transcript_21225/g.56672 Transcript_21225/m.56672 type:complete len:360 (-) Transcript_21225:143-1222(-)
MVAFLHYLGNRWWTLPVWFVKFRRQVIHSKKWRHAVCGEHHHGIPDVAYLVRLLRDVEIPQTLLSGLCRLYLLGHLTFCGHLGGPTKPSDEPGTICLSSLVSDLALNCGAVNDPTDKERGRTEVLRKPGSSLARRVDPHAMGIAVCNSRSATSRKKEPLGEDGRKVHRVRPVVTYPKHISLLPVAPAQTLHKSILHLLRDGHHRNGRIWTKRTMQLLGVPLSETVDQPCEGSMFLSRFVCCRVVFPRRGLAMPSFHPHRGLGKMCMRRRRHPPRSKMESQRLLRAALCAARLGLEVPRIPNVCLVLAGQWHHLTEGTALQTRHALIVDFRWDEVRLATGIALSGLLIRQDVPRRHHVQL